MSRNHPHRDIYENFYGVKLKPEEVVHHRDGVHENNDPGNLRKFKNQSEHIKFHLLQDGHPMQGTVVTEDHKEILRAVNLGNKNSAGHSVSEESRRIMSDKKVKLFKDQSVRDKVSNMMRDKWKDPEYRNRMVQSHKKEKI